MGESAGSNGTLRCELRGNDNGFMYFSAHSPNHLHFILFSDADDLKVFQEWNSWGYYARTFLATDAASKTYEFSRREGAWDKNAPTTHTLKRGEFIITDIYLCEGTWQASPKLPAGQPAKLQVVGRFKNQADKDAMSAGVWTGKIESKPTEIFLEKECVERLNADREQAPTSR
jgi:hypothetical protein